MIRKINLLLFCIFLSLTINSQNFPGVVIGGVENDNGISLCRTNDDCFIIVGDTKSQGEGSSDVYISKIDSFGRQIWSKVYGSIHQDFANSVEPTSDNSYIILGYSWDYGFEREDMHLIKIDENGEKLWDKYYGGYRRDQGFSVKELNDGGYILIGYSKSFEPRGDFYVVRTDCSGNKIWSHNYGTKYVDYGFDVLQIYGGFMLLGTAGGFYNPVQADFQGHDADILIIKINDSGDEIWRKTYGGNEHDFGNVILADADGYYILGSTQSEGNGSFDVLLMKVDKLGNKLWSKTYGNKSFDYGYSFDITSDNCLYLLGATDNSDIGNSIDIFLIKTDMLGEIIWEMTIGGVNSEYGYSVKSTEDSGCVLLGNTKSYGNGKNDIYFIRLDKNGKFLIFNDIADTITDKFSVSVYPNPMITKAIFDVKPKINYSLYNFKLFDINGREVRHYYIKNENKISFSKNTLKSGVYIYTITLKKYPEKIIRGKLIIR